MAARRLPAPLQPGARRGEPITLLVDGRPVEAYEGEPVAAALFAAGRSTLSRSFRFHRPRGLMCSTGQCGWCECRIDGRPSVRSCRVPAIDGTRVDSEHAWPSAGRDLLGLLDLGSRWIAPTFYHHRFLRPRRLRKRYLDVIRWFGGRGSIEPVDDGAAPAQRLMPRSVRRVSVDIAVVGGGPAGTAAARAAAAEGATTLLLEADAAVGGPWRWRAEALPDGRMLDDAVRALDADPRIETIAEATVVSIDGEGLHAVTPAALLEVHARGVVVATGSHERLPTVPGNDRPGVMGARTVEWLIRRYGIVPGERAVFLGTGPDLDRADSALRAGGALTETAEAGSLLRIEGSDHVTGVRVRRAGGGVARLQCDLVVVGERVPAAELARSVAGSEGVVQVVLAGAATGQPIETVVDLEQAAEVGRRLGRAVLDGQMTGPESRTSPRPESAAAASRRAMVCFCEDVRVGEILDERRAGYGDPELLKRRTGALTGPCQGKYCAATLVGLLGPAVEAGHGMPTTRPPARPVRLGDLVALGDEPGATSEAPRR